MLTNSALYVMFSFATLFCAKLDKLSAELYNRSMTSQEISELLNKESYRIWDTTKIIKNQDYHDGVVRGLKMAAILVGKL